MTTYYLTMLSLSPFSECRFFPHPGLVSASMQFLDLTNIFFSGQKISDACPGNYYMENLLSSTGMTASLYMVAKLAAYDAVRPDGLGLDFAAPKYHPYLRVTLAPTGSDVAVGRVIMLGETTTTKTCCYIEVLIIRPPLVKFKCSAYHCYKRRQRRTRLRWKFCSIPFIIEINQQLIVLKYLFYTYRKCCRRFGKVRYIRNERHERNQRRCRS